MESVYFTTLRNKAQHTIPGQDNDFVHVPILYFIKQDESYQLRCLQRSISLT